MSMLEVHAVSKAFGGIHALNACSMHVEKGTIAGLIGPNGSGKTTLFNVMTGYEQVDQGKINFNGITISNSSPDRVFKLGIGRTFQLTRIFPRLTVIENMHVATQRQGVWSFLSRWSTTHEQRQAMELLDFVGISHLKNELAGSLSYGQKKLLELAFILITNPQVILLDEPASGINPTLITTLTEHIRELNKRGITFLVVEHNMEFIMRICHTVTVLHQGTKIAEGTPEQIRNNPIVLDAYLGEEDV